MGQRQGWIQHSYEVGKGREGQRVLWGLILEAYIFAKSLLRWALLLQVRFGTKILCTYCK